MIELVLAPESGQLAVHTPFLIGKGADVHLFYGKCDYPTGKRTLAFPKRYGIFSSVSKGGKKWKQSKRPVVAEGFSVCP